MIKPYQLKIGSLVALTFIAAVMMYSDHNQPNDEQKSAEALSNAQHMAELDAAERRRIEKVLVTVGNEMPADRPYSDKK